MPAEPSIPSTTFESLYEKGAPPWVIGEPQPAVTGLLRDGAVRGSVLDPGCGTGEHTVLLAEAGYDVLGADFAPRAVELARENARKRGVEARFTVADALRLPDELGTGRFDTVVDSALYHVFGDEDRAAYAESLHGVCRPGAVVHLLALSDRGPGLGPQIAESAIREPFGAHPGWEVEEIAASSYTGVVREEQAEAMGREPGERLEVPAWLARIRKV